MACGRGEVPAEIVLVVSNKPDAAGLERAARFSWEAAAERMEAVYRRVVEGQPRGPAGARPLRRRRAISSIAGRVWWKNASSPAHM